MTPGDPATLFLVFVRAQGGLHIDLQNLITMYLPHMYLPLGKIQNSVAVSGINDSYWFFFSDIFKTPRPHNSYPWTENIYISSVFSWIISTSETPDCPVSCWNIDARSSVPAHIVVLAGLSPLLFNPRVLQYHFRSLALVGKFIVTVSMSNDFFRTFFLICLIDWTAILGSNFKNWQQYIA